MALFVHVLLIDRYTLKAKRKSLRTVLALTTSSASFPAEWILFSKRRESQAVSTSTATNKVAMAIACIMTVAQ